MPDTGFPNDRLAELEERWVDDKSPRVFLPLSEEHRRRGEPEKALEILEKGLTANPHHLSGEIARAKLLLEMERWPEAVEILDAVMVRDATHLVAAKLLVEAQLQRGDAMHARRRLDLYRSLNPSDPEIDDLDERIRDLQLADAAPPQSEPAITPIDPTALSEPDGDVDPEDEEQDHAVLIDLDLPDLPASETPPAPAPPFAMDLESKPPSAPEEALSSERPEPPAAEPQDSPVPPAPPAPSRDEGNVLAAEGELENPFAELGRPEDEGRYLLGLGREQIFPVTLPPPAPGEEPEPAKALEPAEAAAAAQVVPPEAPEPEAVSEAPEPADTAVEADSAQTGGDGAAADAAEEGEEDAATATVTLGALYLRQGHPDEAERIFHRVLAREPDSIAARDGLRAVRVAREKAAAEQSTAPETPEAVGLPAEAAPEPEREAPESPALSRPQSHEPLTARDLLEEAPEEGDPKTLRIELLKRYRERLRGAGEGESHVS